MLELKLLKKIKLNKNFIDENDNLSDELSKLNKLYNDGVLTKEEFEKAKKKILDR